MSADNKPLAGKIAVVAGATRGAGRAIAVKLGEAGALVYVTGRSVRGNPSPIGRPETIEETAEMVSAAGGTGIPVRVDHTEEEQVRALFERIRDERDGQLDILVNDVWGGEKLVEWDRSFWEASLETGLFLLRQALHSHIIMAYYAAPLMVRRKRGLIVEITDGVGYHYRGSLFYSMVKTGVSHLAQAMAEDLRPHGVAAVSVTPGFLRSEEMLDHFGVTEANWRDAAEQDVHFLQSETPFFVGQAIASLAADPGIMAKSGQLLSSWGLSDEYGFTDVDGRRPHWGRYAEQQGL